MQPPPPPSPPPPLGVIFFPFLAAATERVLRLTIKPLSSDIASQVYIDMVYKLRTHSVAPKQHDVISKWVQAILILVLEMQLILAMKKQYIFASSCFIYLFMPTRTKSYP